MNWQKRKNSYSCILLITCVDFSLWSDHYYIFSLWLHGPIGLQKETCFLKSLIKIRLGGGVILHKTKAKHNNNNDNDDSVIVFKYIH